MHACTKDKRAVIRRLLALSVMIPVLHGCANAEPTSESIRFGVCADVHKDLMHDADQRIEAFVGRMNQRKVDFIIQLGDFCRPYAHNNGFMAVWNSFEGPRYHVLGNHDTDGGFTREQTVTYWKIPAKYYAFEKGGFHFIVLDGNDKTDPPQPGYARYIGAEQQQWLRRELENTPLPTVIFSHQSLEDPGGIANGEAIRKILEDANQAAGRKKVVACFSGHHHIDYSREINGIHYIQINSMSYFWVGGNYQHVRYSDEIDRDYPWIKYTVPYRDPLFALVTVQSDGTIRIEGTQSEWVGPSPWDIGYPRDKKDRVVPRISTRRLEAVVR
ncbi:MAG: metallophosphoesterase [Sedimentisphaerales bacterium]|nr:metallophosphoesterase [Sedimentisphaerales bacterium]